MKCNTAGGRESLPPPGACTGCGACVNSCPIDSLALIPDKQKSYLHPAAVKEECIYCHQCSKVCPVLNPPPRNNRAKPECIAFMADDEIRQESASGGAFPLLAASFIEQGGIVYGAAWSEDLRAELRAAFDHYHCDKFRRSKYVQCYPNNIYRDIAGHLKAGNKVLFSGCPCQVAGLYSFLGSRRKNLYTIDLFCGQTSPQALFHRYLDETWGLSNIKSWDFRIKDLSWTATPARISRREVVAAWNILPSRYDEIGCATYEEKLGTVNL